MKTCSCSGDEPEICNTKQGASRPSQKGPDTNLNQGMMRQASRDYAFGKSKSRRQVAVKTRRCELYDTERLCSFENFR